MATLVAATCLLAGAADVTAAPLLRSANIDVIFASPVSCEVTMALTVEEATSIEHRIEAFDDSQVELIAVRGAAQVGEPQHVGWTRSLVLRPEQPAYEFRYRSQQPEGRQYRCPLWLPTVPTDGRSREIRIEVALPSQATPPANSLPSFTWAGTQGSTRLGHVPAFVRVVFGRDGEAAEWDIVRMMDLATMAMAVAATGFWLWWRRR